MVHKKVWESSSSQDVASTERTLAAPQGICTEQPPGSHQAKVEGNIPGYSSCCRTMVEISKEDDTAGALHHLMDPFDLVGLLLVYT